MSKTVLEKSKRKSTGRSASKNVRLGKIALSVGKPDVPAPTGWSWESLLDVAEFATGHTPSRRNPEYWNGKISWMNAGDARIFDGKIITETKERINELGLENSAAELLPKDTVCLSRTGASIGYTVILGKPMATNQGFVNYICSKHLLPKYLMYLFLFERSSIISYGEGSAYKTVYFPEAKGFHILLPPLNEQKRIVSKIEELFSIIDLTIQSLNKILIQMKQFKKSLLMNTFEKTSKEWKEETVNDVIKIIDYRGRTPPYSDRGITHLRSNNIKNGTIVWENLKYVTEETYEKYMTRGIPQKNDLLFTTEGPLGEVALVPELKFSLAQRLMILRPLGHNSKFLLYQIMSPDFNSRLTGKKTGTTIPGISSRNFKPMKIYTTSLDEEEKIANYLETQLSKHDNMVPIVNSNLKILRSMKKSILKQAFKGKLVPQDPNDKPAETLLEKIKQEKQKIIKVKPKPRRKKNVK